jgi:hypothetical protein
MLSTLNAIATKSVQRGKAAERHITTLSRLVWPWRDALLVPLAALLAALDLISTYFLLEHSNKTYVYESGPLARWALGLAGFNGLYIMNVVAVAFLCSVATGARLFYARLGLSGFARAAYVLTLVPYTITVFAAVVNNVLLTII